MNRLLPTLSQHAHHHVKHAIAAFAYAWFATGPAGRPGAVSSQAS